VKEFVVGPSRVSALPLAAGINVKDIKKEKNNNNDKIYRVKLG
jgi:hypothetical protein